MSTTPCFLPGVTLLAPPNPSFSPVHVTATRGHQWPGEARLAHSMAAGSIEMFYVDPWCILLVILRVFHNELYQKVRVEPPRDLAVMKYDGTTPWTSSPSLTTVCSQTNLEDEMKDGDNTIFPATSVSAHKRSFFPTNWLTQTVHTGGTLHEALTHDDAPHFCLRAHDTLPCAYDPLAPGRAHDAANVRWIGTVTPELLPTT
jgi:hypothetical protein